MSGKFIGEIPQSQWSIISLKEPSTNFLDWLNAFTLGSILPWGVGFSRRAANSVFLDQITKLTCDKFWGTVTVDTRWDTYKFNKREERSMNVFFCFQRVEFVEAGSIEVYLAASIPSEGHYFGEEYVGVELGVGPL